MYVYETTSDSEPIWTPSPARVQSSTMHRFAREAERVSGRALADYDALWRWSIDEPERFWSLVWSFCRVIGEPGQRVLIDRDRMPGARWFADARLNLAENLLREDVDPDSDAIVFWGEDKVRRRVSRAQLRRQVAVTAAALRAQGVGPGDCVAAFMPNMPETLVAMLAAVSLGAVFTSTSPDFGIQGVLDRFGQTRPKVLFAVDGYWYAGKRIDCAGKVADIAGQLPGLERVVLVPYLETSPTTTGIPHAQLLGEFLGPHSAIERIEFARLPFDHPVYVLYSSGTTGVPKGIVHGAGGTLLQHLKEQQLHCDVRPGDRYFYFTTCGWTMWNILVSALASGATLLMYDGSPFVGGGRILFQLAEAERMTHFGTSAKFIDAVAKAGLEPRREFDLGSVRVILSTGSPLVPESYDFVYRAIKPDVQLSSMSGGTDICSAFVIGSPTLPVWRGEIQCRGLGMAVDVFDDAGRPVREAKGELVCTRTFPCMPVGFWNDAGRQPLPRRVLRALRQRLVPRRLQRDHAPWRHRHLRPLGCGAQSRWRPDRHGRDLPPGREAARHRRVDRGRAGLERGRPGRAVRATAGGRCVRRGIADLDSRRDPRECDSASRPRQDPPRQ